MESFQKTTSQKKRKGILREPGSYVKGSDVGKSAAVELMQHIKFNIDQLTEPGLTSNEMQLSPDVIERRRNFERQRREHYNEFSAIQLARKLMAEEFGEYETEEQLRGLGLTLEPGDALDHHHHNASTSKYKCENNYEFNVEQSNSSK